MISPSTNAQQKLDKRFMRAAIRLSNWHLGLSGENPSVGALIVEHCPHGPVVVGGAITAIGGRPHAEVLALKEAGARAHGATAYVTLEPCAHYGKTPPCAKALIEAGIKRVVIALKDPDARVSGKGISMLEAAGIEVIKDVEADYAAQILAGYLKRKQSHRPYVTVKLAISQDGAIGQYGKGQVAITNQISHGRTQILRAQSDGILVGVGSAIEDDPMLNCRLDGLLSRSPIRIVIDPHLRLPMTSKLVTTARAFPLWLITGQDIDTDKADLLSASGVEIIPFSVSKNGIDLHQILLKLGERGLSSLLVEGGAMTAGQFYDADLIDKIILYRGGIKIGNTGIKAPLFTGLSTRYRLWREANYAADMCQEWIRR